MKFSFSNQQDYLWLYSVVFFLVVNPFKYTLSVCPYWNKQQSNMKSEVQR